MSDIELFDDPDTPAHESFTVDSLRDADWAARHILRHDAEIERFTVLAKELKKEAIERIATRLAEIVSDHLKGRDYLVSLLRPWGEVEIAKQGKKKSFKLLSATIGLHTGTGTLEVTDEEKAVAWLEEHGHPECVKVTKTVKKDETKEVIKTSGEVPDGTEYRPGETRFYVEPLPPLLE